MKLKAHLTVGWENSENISAYDLHNNALKTLNYSESLVKSITHDSIYEVYGVDKLFRRGSKGFGDIKKFFAALTEDTNDHHTLICHVDVFAYSFLKYAKNFDFLFEQPEYYDKNFKEKYIVAWRNKIDTYEKFELFGNKKLLQVEKKAYLSLREIATRKSARDEWRLIASLIMSGPGTLEEICQELNIGYTLKPRILKPFINKGFVNMMNDDMFIINIRFMPIVLYFLRELLGIDLLGGIEKWIK
jgi:hypothetical protein